MEAETDLHKILTSFSNFIKSPAEVEAHRKVDLEDQVNTKRLRYNLMNYVINSKTLFYREVTI